MIIHIQHHKEGRDFSKRPVTGNYTDCHVYININKFNYSLYGNNDPRTDYYFNLEYKGDKKELVESVNTMCNSNILYLHEDSNQLWLHRRCFPEILEQLPSENYMPKVYTTNPTRLVEIGIY